MWPLAIIFGPILAYAWKAGQSAKNFMGEQKTKGTSMYNVASWTELANKFRGDIPLKFILKFIELESGGNPCATPGYKDVNGNVKETGIFQFYRPDTSLPLNYDKLRAACVASGNAKQMSACARPLTGPEMEYQITSGIQLINRDAKKASSQLNAVGARWPIWSDDYCAMVKLQHALPAISSKGLPAVTKLLGRAPINWNEFQSTVETKLNKVGWIKGYPPVTVTRCMNNARKTAFES